MTKNFKLLVYKLNVFKLRYYLFQLLRGVIITVTALLIVYTVFSLVEYFIYLPSETRKITFYGFILFSILLIIKFLVFPLLYLLNILRPLSLKRFSLLIQQHFPSIRDKLLNIIELSEYETTDDSNELVLASIDQKIEQLKVFDFNKAISYRNVRLVAVYLLISALVAMGILMVNKSIFTESTLRIVHYNQHFTKPAPFVFNIQNKQLEVKKGDAFIINVKLKGEDIPNVVYITIEGNNYLMKNTGDGAFQFEIASVVNPFQFHFTDLKFHSDTYHLALLPKPAINNFSCKVVPPKYTGLQSRVFNNLGDLQVPCGTNIIWKFSGIDMDSLYIEFNDSVRETAVKKNKVFTLKKKLYKSQKYNVFIQNKQTFPELALSYFADVIPDMYPEIKLHQVQDSVKITRFFFKGIISDDYGFSSLKFHYNINNTDSAVVIPVSRSLADHKFYYSFDFSDLQEPEGLISYYFSVSDNDAVNHYKTTTSESFSFRFPNPEELEKFDKQQFDKLENMLGKSRQIANEIQKDLQKLRLKNMENSLSDWEKSQMVTDIVQKQNKLENLYEQIKQDNERLNNFMNSFDKENAEILEKQKQIEDLLDEVFTDELKQLMEEFNKLAENFDSKKLNSLTKDMNLSFNDLQKQLDRNLEMLKKMKIEQKFQKVIDKANEMANEEEKLVREIKEKKNFDQAKKELKNHQEELDNIQQQLKDALKINNELENKINFDEFKEDFKAIKESMEESQKSLEKGSRNKSEKNLKNTSEKMKNMASDMQKMLDSNTMEQNMENIDNLRQILSNLMHISFSQENILNDLVNVSSKDPRLVTLNEQQKRIINQSQIVKDSLYALAMRTPQINQSVNNELIRLEMNLDKAASEMEEAMFPQARSSQQFAMTAANNLALLLNEVLEQIEKQLKNSKPGSGQCKNQGGQGSSGMQDLKKSSQSIKKQLEKMIQQMKNGNSQGMSKQLGQSLMQHEMMQKMLHDLMTNGSVGSGTKDVLKQIDKMLDKNRQQLMNRLVNAEMIKRQKLITTRLLEAEKAEMERDFDDKRESKSAKEFYSNPAKYFDYKQKEEHSIEYLNKNAHKLNRFYNAKYKQYLNNIQEK